MIEFILFLPILSLSVDPVFFQLSSSFIIHYFFHELFKVILVGSELLMKMKKKSEKADLKLSIHKTKMMASGPITSWQIDGKKVEAVADFLGLTVDGDCSHEIKRCLLLGRKAMTNSTLKSRDITLPTKVCLVKAMIFPVVMYGCESWTIKKAERQRIDGFELWC